jgi:coproporphyrinogen III oxidase-like Fe-S oxidoreductase
MSEHHESRSRWPYPALLPHSLKAYPVVQVAPRVGPQPVWPPPMPPALVAWRDETAYQGSIGSQIYLHVPFCPFLCHFCPLYKVPMSKRSDERKERFVQTLIEEIELYGATPSVAGRRFNTLYFGGGTPTELTPAQLGRIIQALRRNFTITPDAEITLEGVARQMLAPGYLEQAFEQGFNRISFGVQSLDLRQRQRIGRGDKVVDYPALVELVRQLKPDANVNCEIMAGLPEQTFETFEQDLKGIMSWRTDSLDILYYVHMPGTKLTKLVSTGQRGGPEYGGHLLQLRQFTNSVFREQGWKQVTGEVFVRQERDLFVHTSFGGGGNGLNSLLALGPSSFGHLNGTVYQNVCDLDQYEEAVSRRHFPVGTAQTMDLATARRRALLLSLLRMEVPEFLIQTPWERYLEYRWKQHGLIERTPGGYRLSERGALWYNHMQMDTLPLTEMMKLLRMFGSIQEQEKALSGGELDSQSRELLSFVRGSMGPTAVLGYKALLKIQQLPFFDQRAIGFTGPVQVQG